MTTLTFEFNDAKVAGAGLTTDELLEDMRRYGREHGVSEISYGVFRKDGEDSMATLLKYAVWKQHEDPLFRTYLTKLEANIDGEVEDCFI